MCVFLCPKGGKKLTNQQFMLVSDSDKSQKLITVLRSRTHDSLSNEQIRYLMMGIALGYQYSIEVFTEPQSFCEALVLHQTATSSDRGKIIFGQALFNHDHESCGQLFEKSQPAAAIVTRCSKERAEERLILIYIPLNLYEKGTQSNERQGFQAKTCI